jgi:cobalt-zinc-cadmium resistance protein CzcA
LPVDAFPDVSPNLVQIFTITEGLAPEEIEMYVTYPVEAAMTGLPAVEKIRSVSNFGLSVVNVYFEDDVSIYFARQLVGERLQEARNHHRTNNELFTVFFQILCAHIKIIGTHTFD